MNWRKIALRYGFAVPILSVVCLQFTTLHPHWLNVVKTIAIILWGVIVLWDGFQSLSSDEQS